MVNKRLVNYIKEQLKEGYDTASLRGQLLKYGYSSQDVDAAIRDVQSPEVRHVIHFSPTVLVTIAIVFIGLVSVIFALFYLIPPKTPAQLLDLNIEVAKTTVKAGDTATIFIEISNIGSAKRYDILIRYELINQKTNEISTLKEETVGIETRSSKQTNVLVPVDSEKGNYILRAIATYNGNRAVSTITMKVEGEPEGAEEEQGIIEESKEEIPEEPEIIQEEEMQIRDRSDALTTYETINKVEKIAPSNRLEAERLCAELKLQTSRDLCFNKIAEVLGDKTYCGKINDERTRDVCLSNVAKITSNSEICEEISKDSRKDNCYMNFVVEKKDYTVCDKVTHQYLRQSCESLKQLSKLNITDVSFYESLLNRSSIELV